MRLQLVRGSGDKHAPPVVEELLTTEEAGTERGRLELDETCSDRRRVSAEVLPFTYKPPGTIVSVTEADSGSVKVGVLRSLSYTFSSGNGGIPTTTYSIEIEEIL